MVNFLNRRHYS